MSLEPGSTSRTQDILRFMTHMAATNRLTSNSRIRQFFSIPLSILAGLLAVCLSLPTATSHAADDIVYINDTLRVGIRPQPNNKSKPLGLVVTGDKLEVLARDGNYVQVRTGNGLEGWVKKNYITTNLPASTRLKQIQERFNKLSKQFADLKNREPADPDQEDNPELAQENNVLKEQINLLQKQLGKADKQRSNLEKQLAAGNGDKVLAQQLAELKEQNTALAERLAESAGFSGSGTTTSTSVLPWFYWLAIIIGATVIAFIAGGLWFRQQAMRRLGGLEI